MASQSADRWIKTERTKRVKMHQNIRKAGMLTEASWAPNGNKVGWVIKASILKHFFTVCKWHGGGGGVKRERGAVEVVKMDMSLSNCPTTPELVRTCIFYWRTIKNTPLHICRSLQGLSTRTEGRLEMLSFVPFTIQQLRTGTKAAVWWSEETRRYLNQYSLIFGYLKPLQDMWLLSYLYCYCTDISGWGCLNKSLKDNWQEKKKMADPPSWSCLNMFEGIALIPCFSVTISHG